METDLTRMLEAFCGQRCWHVAAGAIGYAFSAEFGDKVGRDRPLLGKLSGPSPDEFELFKGYASLMIWCPWRLDGNEAPISSSAEDRGLIERKLQSLIGRTVQKATVISTALDLLIEFDAGLKLRVFSEYTADVDLGHNWSCHLGTAQCIAGPGVQWRICREA
ncbi:MAG: hypothetical protein IT452_12785 [Planctomycetia bacterium]|nr:hypothetical protein [Planctomycetia bacterium]